MKIKTKKFQALGGARVNLKKSRTLVKPFYHSQDDYQNVLQKHVDKMSHLQNLHYATNRNALLLIFQGMDGAGKDGTIKHVMSGVNPQGCQVFSFKHPSATELEHDFLWRTNMDLPERGKIGIFNRSYYEEVLITRVHPKIIKAEGLNSDVHQAHNMQKFWQERYHSINELEKHLSRNGTKVIKFFLHLSCEEQRKRFLARIDDPDKNWKLSQGDIHERKYWKQYVDAYEECLNETSTASVPWYIIPADDKLNARLIVSQIIIDVLEGFKMKYPRTDTSRVKELKAIRKQLASQGKSHHDLPEVNPKALRNISSEQNSKTRKL
jgi:PPK2 family polyphosphate:nucleotide phosphotransferase